MLMWGVLWGAGRMYVLVKPKANIDRQSQMQGRQGGAMAFKVIEC